MNELEEPDDDLEEETFPDSTSRDFAKAMDDTWLKTRNSDFATLRREYQMMEAEYISRAGDNQFYVIETKRRVAEAILKAAVDREEPFDTCENFWRDLLVLGFTDLERQCSMSWYFADCCLRNKHAELGLGIVEPVVMELHRLLAEPTVAEQASKFYRQELGFLEKLARNLTAQLNPTST